MHSGYPHILPETMDKNEQTGDDDWVTKTGKLSHTQAGVVVVNFWTTLNNTNNLETNDWATNRIGEITGRQVS